MNTIYSFNAQSIDGQQVSLDRYRGQCLLIVNTASQCGFTPQYQGLEALYQRYKAQGLVVLGFPCNQFGKQEPASNPKIAEFCQLNYGVSFPLFAKLDVNGAEAHPLFKFLTSQAPGVLGSQAIKWNFTKFLINTDGTVFRRYGSLIPPSQLNKDIETVLRAMSS